MEEDAFPATLSFRILKSAFIVLLVLSSITASLLTLAALLALFALVDWDSWDERGSEDAATLRLAVAFLLLVTAVNAAQVYAGWRGIRNRKIKFLTVYLVFEGICSFMWFLCFLFQEDKTLPSFKLLTSFVNVVVTFTMIYQMITTPDDRQTPEQETPD